MYPALRAYHHGLLLAKKLVPLWGKQQSKTLVENNQEGCD